MPRRLPILVLATAALALAGGPRVAAQTGAPEHTPTVDVLERGKSPRSELRYTAPAGTSQTLKMRTDSTVSQTIGGRTRTGRTPSIVFTIEVSVTAVDADGTMHVAYEYTSIDVSDDRSGTVDQSRNALQPLIGLAGAIVVSPTGAVVSSDLNIPPGLEPAAQQLIGQLSSQASQLAVRFTPTGTDQELLLLSSKTTATGDNVLQLAHAPPLPVAGDASVETRQRLRAQGQLVRQTTKVNLFINGRR